MNMDETQAEILLTNKVNITEGNVGIYNMIFHIFTQLPILCDNNNFSLVFLYIFAFQFGMGTTLKAEKSDSEVRQIIKS